MDECALTEALITYDTSTPEGISAAAAFVKGWLEARDVEVVGETHNGLPLLAATVGAPEGAPTVVLHGHLDVVPAEESQYEPRFDGDRLYGRGAYDMKGGLAAMMCALVDCATQNATRVHFVCVSDEESDLESGRGSERAVQEGYVGDFAITGEPTNLHIGVQAKGVLAIRVVVHGRSAHGSTPWLGDNAAVKAIDVFRAIESLPFSRESSDLFDRPSLNLGVIQAGDVRNRVPDRCTMDVDIRFLPGQEPEDIRSAIAGLGDIEVETIFCRRPIVVERDEPYVRALAESVSEVTHLKESIAVGRDGTSDVIYFLDAGMPGVEFGPIGDGHHGPEEWVSVESLALYRRALVDFIARVPGQAAKPTLRVAQ